MPLQNNNPMLYAHHNNHHNVNNNNYQTYEVRSGMNNNTMKPFDNTHISATPNYSNTNNNTHIPHPYHYQQPQQVQNTSFGPHSVLNLMYIQQQLRRSDLTESDIITMSREAILNGVIEDNKILLSNVYCHVIRYKQLKFVLTEGFDAVVSIIWDVEPKLIDNNSSTLNQINTNQFHANPVVHNNTHFVNQPAVFHQQPQPLRPAVIQQRQQPPTYNTYECKQQQQHIAYPQQQTQMQPPQQPNKLIDTVSIDDEEISEIEDIIDKIEYEVNLDVDADPDLYDFRDTLHHHHNGVGQQVPATLDSLKLPQVNRLKTQTSFYSINGDDAQSVATTNNNGKPLLGHVCSQNDVLIDAAMSDSASSSGGYGPDIKISNGLWNDLKHRFDGHPTFSSKQDLIRNLQSVITSNNAQIQHIGDRQEWCVWVHRLYVYITENDQSTLVDVFDYNQFHNHYGECIQRLYQRKYNTPSSIAMQQNGLQTNIHHQTGTNTNIQHVAALPAAYRMNSGRKLVKNASGRSIVSTTSSCNTSKRSLFGGDGVGDKKLNDGQYHTIYLKPIIERIKALTYTVKGASMARQITVDSDYIINIVDNAIKRGVKRQISKRTFEFKWNFYTVIMSKSLKTILDVTLSTEKDIITVHPDVVSIISKKCPQLDYFTIQKLAKQAKLKASFTTKKNDYRQQFIYEYCGCRIVFASNHTTIVEMQCNDPSAINIHIQSL